MENAHNSKWERDHTARERNQQRDGTNWEDARTFVTAEPPAEEPVNGSFIIPQWIDLTDEEDEMLTQSALEYGRQRAKREEPDLSQEEIEQAEKMFDQMGPGGFLAYQWAREDAATEEYLQEKERAQAEERSR